MQRHEGEASIAGDGVQGKVRAVAKVAYGLGDLGVIVEVVGDHPGWAEGGAILKVFDLAFVRMIPVDMAQFKSLLERL